MSNFMNERVTIIKRNGERYDNVAANVQRGKVFTERADVPVEEGDTIERKLPNGVVEQFVVEDPGFMAAIGSFRDHYQMKVRRATAQSAQRNATTIYNVTGPNARVNINSNDSSSNIINIAADELFAKIRETLIAAPMVADRRDEVLIAVDGMERTRNTPEYLRWYSQFVAGLADHIALVSPFLPALAQFMAT
jgi:hypothetical protein